MITIYCSHCGKEIMPNWNYCPFCGFKVGYLLKKKEEHKKFSETKQEVISKLTESQRKLFDELRLERVKIAEEKGVPPFVIAHDRLLVDICIKKPTTEEELLQIKGIGKRKLSWVKTLLPIIQQHKARN